MRRMEYKEHTCGDCHKAVAVCVMFASYPRSLKKLIYRCARCAAEAHARNEHAIEDARVIAHQKKRIEAFGQKEEAWHTIQELRAIASR